MSDFPSPSGADFLVKMEQSGFNIQPPKDYQMADYWLCAAIRDDGSAFHARTPKIMASVFLVHECPLPSCSSIRTVSPACDQCAALARQRDELRCNLCGTPKLIHRITNSPLDPTDEHFLRLSTRSS